MLDDNAPPISRRTFIDRSGRILLVTGSFIAIAGAPTGCADSTGLDSSCDGYGRYDGYNGYDGYGRYDGYGGYDGYGC